MDSLGYLSRGLNRSKTYRLLVILLVTVLSLVVIVAVYGPRPNVRTL